METDPDMSLLNKILRGSLQIYTYVGYSQCAAIDSIFITVLKNF